MSSVGISHRVQALTFRISNIPLDVSRADIEGDLKVTFQEGIEATELNPITLLSLSPSPFDPTKEQIAIVTFNPVPVDLKELKDQLRIYMGRGDQVKPQYLATFDSHFIGLTPLNEVSSNACFE